MKFTKALWMLGAVLALSMTGCSDFTWPDSPADGDTSDRDTVDVDKDSDSELTTEKACLAKSGSCWIDGGCYSYNELDPLSPCKVCVGLVNPRAWTSVPKNTTCETNDLCIYGASTCDGAGNCVGAAITCTDDEGTCGARRSCNGTDTCTVTYPPVTTSCDDGYLGTYDDHCDGVGGCMGSFARCENDAETCGAQRDFNGTATCTVVYPTSIITCDDGNDCTYDDRCDGTGFCKGTPITCESDPGTCGILRTCQGTNSCKLTYPDSTISCSDNNKCTKNDVCNGHGLCVGTSYSCTTPGFCEKATGATCNGDGTCTYPADIGASCDDGNDCTYDDVCGSDKICKGITITCSNDAGICGAKRSCDGTRQCTEFYADNTTTCETDNLDCTTDHCNGAGMCLHSLLPNKCQIEGVCYERFDTNPANQCQWCDATTNSWANKPDQEQCDDGNACTYGDLCDGYGSCLGIANTGASCDDGNACTYGETCTAEKTCTGGILNTCNGNGACNVNGICICDSHYDGLACDTCIPSYTNYPSCNQCNSGYHDENGLCITDGYKRVNAGTFTMGSPPTELGRLSNETQHQVTLTYNFEIMAMEVTQAQWTATFPDTNPSWFGGLYGGGTACGTNCPVERVNWYEALAYANKLSTQKGLTPCYVLSSCSRTLGGGCGSTSSGCGNETYTCTVALNGVSKPQDCTGFRLPTEAEWEYAARAGTTTSTYNGQITKKDCTSDPALAPIGWYCFNSGSTTHPVGQKAPNGWGLYDMSGNVAEWVWDSSDFLDYGSGSVTDPTGLSTVSGGVTRGGFWNNLAHYVRSAFRDGTLPYVRSNYVGFRLVRSLP